MLVQSSGDFTYNTYDELFAKLVIKKKCKRPMCYSKKSCELVLNKIFQYELKEIMEYDIEKLLLKDSIMFLTIDSLEKLDYVEEKKRLNPRVWEDIRVILKNCSRENYHHSYPLVNRQLHNTLYKTTPFLADAIAANDEKVIDYILQEGSVEFKDFTHETPLNLRIVEWLNKQINHELLNGKTKEFNFTYLTREAYMAFKLRKCEIVAHDESQAIIAQELSEIRGSSFVYRSNRIADFLRFPNAVIGKNRIPRWDQENGFEIDGNRYIFKCKTQADIVGLREICNRPENRVVVFVWTKSKELFDFAEQEVREYVDQISFHDSKTYEKLVRMDEFKNFTLCEKEFTKRRDFADALENEVKKAIKSNNYYRLAGQYNGFYVYPFAVQAEQNFYLKHKNNKLHPAVFPFISQDALKFLLDKKIFKKSQIRFLLPYKIKYLCDRGYNLNKRDKAILDNFI